ncbi:XrtA/PEP-CTERM system histidine kinase PrsK [Sphingobium abikonense]|uniref:XrtA/PEP-CTERM system histidine kinase PrsK n=1 Tax=Sphingobium abikonense TaxID=86193 RepID=UPI0035151996
MPVFLQIVGDWGHALAATLFAALGIWLLRRRDGSTDLRCLAAAMLLTSGWALYISFGSVAKPLSGLGENIRNAGWLLAMFVLLRRAWAGRQGPKGGVVAVYAAVAGLILLQTVTDLSWRQFSLSGDVQDALIATTLVLRMMTAIGSLLLLHQLYSVCPVEERSGLAPLLGALAAMWGYDFALYLIGYVAPQRAAALFALRGLLMAVVAAFIAIGVRRDLSGRVQLSRALTMQSLSVFAIGLYVVLIAAVAILIEMIAGPYARLVEIGAVFFTAVTALVLLPSPRLQAVWRLQVAKHFFQHRYDYRTEWMRFGETIGRSGDASAPLGQRVAKAVADITQSPAAILLLRDEEGSLSVETHWNWSSLAMDAAPIPAKMTARLEQGHIIDVGRAEEAAALPRWLAQDRQAWAMAPLIHYGRLIGAILLARPPVDRRLDWEDLDMLRAAGRQAASHISEAQGQQALADAQRFDEFNRRFAFILHDVKNLVSQLSLLTHNAERHADNPDFRADMILTLKESVGRMNAMLGRLSQHQKAAAQEARAFGLQPLLVRIAAMRSRHHAVRIEGTAPDIMADPVRTEQIILHLVQNAIDASPPDRPVVIRLGRADDMARIDIIDQGSGMSAEYIRRELFKPFASSKAGGFGLGAFEARALAQAMGGRIMVESQAGVGSRFSLFLPLASAGDRPAHGEQAA